jgi:hypothetical protein
MNSENTMTKKWTKAEIRNRLETDDKWLTRGLVAIYKRQTDSEQNAGMTKEENGVGFNGVDSVILSDMAKQFMNSGSLSRRQIEFVRKLMLKYSGQLEKIAQKKL